MLNSVDFLCLNPLLQRYDSIFAIIHVYLYVIIQVNMLVCF